MKSLTVDVELIKRYPNRKLYSTSLSRYVTHGELVEAIHHGLIIKVIDNKTSSDITNDTLKQAFFEKLKKSKVSNDNLIRLINRSL